MTDQHTPGPWHWERDTKGRRVRLVSRTRRTLLYPGADKWGESSCEVSDADAALIDAAPEMFELLRYMIRGIPDAESFRVGNKLLEKIEGKDND